MVDIVTKKHEMKSSFNDSQRATITTKAESIKPGPKHQGQKTRSHKTDKSFKIKRRYQQNQSKLRLQHEPNPIPHKTPLSEKVLISPIG